MRANWHAVWTLSARYGRLVLALALLGAALASLAAWDWRLELFSHFQPFYLICTLLGAFWLKQRRWRIALLLISVILLWQMALALSSPVQSVVEHSKPLRAIAMNLLLSNTEYQQTEQWLLAQQADVIVLTEATPLWQQHLANVQKVMPYGCAAWEDSSFGIAALLKEKPIQCEVLYTDQQYRLFPYVRIELADNTVIYGIHPPPPLGIELATARNEALLILAERIAKESQAVIVLGDMNITPYSPLYQAFRRDAGLSEIGFAGWPTWSPMKGLPLLPLDRALVRGLAGRLSVAPHLGSDHRAIVLDVE
ncbi:MULTISPECIES: endonuclease/exonuclease/phosphatase family protein [Deefgea]|uniref:Endonuclease/exonuclease/phosphatase domain-containing protein n=1 Tax=Deefgea chitinilytica TaxID=570276 RepID=A0ABS2CCZ2_9NEIS|nr:MULTISPECIES: endonuclease/exonuclease/phosphatase family protein [Deefgea]MBM5571912.1 hypothetical protein [Deefgea chitinilytica]MBM9889147.1 endonuclease/exonuclease/phosphatase family protein [Deefgea sp. CFH1-16]